MLDDISVKITKYISSKILKKVENNLKPDDPLITSGIVGSFDLMDLALFVEDTYGVVIDDTELNSDTFDTAKQLAVMIRDRQS
ncbi:MAG: acyl carrier protein [Anaerolineaceae bacterium]|nr:acyl carrier protein [Anaerolineaceae bacterium]